MTKRIKRKTGDPTPAQKAAATRRRNKLKAEQRTKPAEQKPDKPAVEKSTVKITPYPRTGDNKTFENILDDAAREKRPPPESAKPAGPAIGDEILTAADVAEWVAWPFMLWAQTNELPSLALSSKDALSVAEPLTSILNRHGASRVLPPDVVDGLKIGARLTPVMADRVSQIKAERQRRAAHGSTGKQSRAEGQGGPLPAQGAAVPKPKEV